MKSWLMIPFLAMSLSACSGGGGDTSSTSLNDPGDGQFVVEAWADNWFAMYIGDELIAEDSESITTERSFNAEAFSFDGEYPLVLSFILKDFKENDTGLEYIGSDKQQMGDGGFIAQIKDASSGKVIGASSSTWKCKAIHRAPMNKTCEKDANPAQTCLSEIEGEPAEWKSAGFDDSTWAPANEYSATEVGAKDGYDMISWDSSAKIIWTSDLETDNTLLCRYAIGG
jgi:hypothetical protein